MVNGPYYGDDDGHCFQVQFNRDAYADGDADQWLSY